MTSISERLAKCFEESLQCYDAHLGVHDDIKPLVSALVECVRALELVYRSDPSLAKLNAALEKMEGDRGDK